MNEEKKQIIYKEMDKLSLSDLMDYFSSELATVGKTIFEKNKARFYMLRRQIEANIREIDGENKIKINPERLMYLPDAKSIIYNAIDVIVAELLRLDRDGFRSRVSVEHVQFVIDDRYKNNKELYL